MTVLVLEQGPRLRPADFEHDELKYAYLHGITNDPVASPQTFRRDPARARDDLQALAFRAADHIGRFARRNEI